MIELIKDSDGNVLHVVCTDNVDSSREDIVDPNEFIQVARMKPEKGHYFEPHYHLRREVPFDSIITQETWVILKGSIKASYFDSSRNLIRRQVLRAGDCTITLGGGHSYKCLEDGTDVYEIKNGPYVGRDNDKAYFKE
jgi:cupin fold WbuC family metalloprotein